MRAISPLLAATVFGLGFAAALAAPAAQAAVGMIGAPVLATTPAVTKVEYFCSPGFEPSYNGTCVAVPSRAEVEIFVEQPIYETSETVHHYRHRRAHHGIRARF